jgi:glycosyltransferase involved in cell wall biosynthesis
VANFVLHVITTTNRGGAENQLLLLAREQVKLGSKVFVVDLKGESELGRDFLESGVKIIHNLVNKSFLLQIIELRRILLDLPPNTVIHAHLPQAELVCSFAKRKNPLVITRHFGGRFKPTSHLFFSSILGLIASYRASKVIAISESVKQLLIKNREVFRNRDLEVIHYGFDRISFRAQVAEFRSGLISPPIALGTVSRLSPEKNVHLIIEAYAELRKMHNLSHLRIVGVGPLEVELKSLCTNLGIQDDVEFLGKQKNIAEFMNGLDVFILASSFEGFGMVLVEAMAVGKRIVASRNSAIEEILSESDCGVLFETGNLKSLIAGIEEVLEFDYELMAAAQIKRLTEYKIASTAKKTLSVYKAVSHSV